MFFFRSLAELKCIEVYANAASAAADILFILFVSRFFPFYIFISFH